MLGRRRKPARVLPLGREVVAETSSGGKRDMVEDQRGGSTEERARPAVGFVMEQTLGHVTHYANLRAAVDANPTVSATWYPLNFAPNDRLERLPFLRSNWSARASWRAWSTLMRADAAHRFDSLFFHTQVTTLLCSRLMRRVPSVVSLDATPRNYDVVGAAYGHRQGPAMVEALKRSVNARSLHAARALVTWCEWARQSLIHDYGVAGDRVAVIPPGVNLKLWPRPEPREGTGPVRILFVGGDFARKGGEVLLSAFAGLSHSCELHLVTKAPVESNGHVFVYRDATPNSEVLRNLYATADIFVLPTLADCFPLVVQEALAAGLPVISTDVGAISEAVVPNVTGVLVPPGDVSALRGAIEDLASDTARRKAIGMRGRAMAEERFDSAINAQRILAMVTGVASR